jgi:ferredoxin
VWGSHMRIVIDSELCQGHALCFGAAPDLFDLRDDDGHAEVRVSEVPEQLISVAQRAAQGCPEGAISIIDEQDGGSSRD